MSGTGRVTTAKIDDQRYGLILQRLEHDVPLRAISRELAVSRQVVRAVARARQELEEERKQERNGKLAKGT